jgi:hypothetical protein
MGLPRSTYYDAPPVKADDAEIVATTPRSAVNLRLMAIAGLVLSFAIKG